VTPSNSPSSTILLHNLAGAAADHVRPQSAVGGVAFPTQRAKKTRHSDFSVRAFRHHPATTPEHLVTERPVARPSLLWGKKEGAMPIRPFLQNGVFDEVLTHAMGVAFEHACAALGLADKSDPMTELVACKIIDAATAGERDPDKLLR
jgi:hypothetical protein